MISSEAMGRETSDRGTAVSSAGPLESLVKPHAATEVAILAPRLQQALQCEITSIKLEPFVFACGQLDLSH